MNEKIVDFDAIGEKDKDCLQLAEAIAGSSRCFSKKVGAVLLIKEGKYSGKMVAGHNGPPTEKDCSELFGTDGCPRKAAGAKSGQMMEMCPSVHAEMEAILLCARSVVPTDGSTMYCIAFPCKDCAKEMIKAGVVKLVCFLEDEFDHVGLNEYNFGLAEKLLEEAKIEVVFVRK